MKQAILITAYKNFKQLNKLINEFNEDFNIYIHIDKKSVVTKEILQELTNNSNVQYIGQNYKVNWGGLNHLKSYLKLSERALKNSDNIYFHLITGEDYPVRNNDDFKLLIDKNNDYLEHFEMPAVCWPHDNGGMDRLAYYNFYDLFNAKKSMIWIKLFRQLQSKFGFKRPINDDFGKWYGGSTYWSLSRDTLQFVINFTKENPNFLKRFKYTVCAEEIYFQTIIMNSKYAKNVINDNLRFIDWESKRGSNPAFLDESDFKVILKSKAIFARKINMQESRLIHMLSSNRNL